MSVGLVIVSHSARLSEGVSEIAKQMAPDVRVLPAGGLQGGDMGTDFEKVSAALSDALVGDGVVLLYDLGSAQMTAELAVETLGDPSVALVVDAPLVEGAVASAVAAQGGADLEAVARAAEAAVSEIGASPAVLESPVLESAVPGPAESANGAAVAEHPGVEQSGEVRSEITLHNDVGLHARPAALLARSLTGLRASVTVTLGDTEADASSVLAVMGLGARKGDQIVLRGTGHDARQALDQIIDLADRDFDA